MVSQNDELWDQLSALTASIDRLRREIARCLGKSPYKDDVQRQYADTQTRRQEIVEQLCQAASEVG